MEFHQGRLLDDVHLRVSDLEASKRFYRAALEALGSRSPARAGARSWRTSSTSATTGGRRRACTLPSRPATAAPWSASTRPPSPLAAGTTFGPVTVTTYRPGYYAADVLDPDGINVEAVFHGPTTRSAPPVVVTPTLIQARQRAPRSSRSRACPGCSPGTPRRSSGASRCSVRWSARSSRLQARSPARRNLDRHHRNARSMPP